MRAYLESIAVEKECNAGDLCVAPIAPKVLLADDLEEMRRTVASMLAGEFQIVGMAENGLQVIELALSRLPDLLIVDIFMPELNGIETAFRVKASGCSCKVLFLTAHEDADFVEAAMSIGASGYVLKTQLATDLIPAIHRVLEGGIFISQPVHSPRDFKWMAL